MRRFALSVVIVLAVCAAFRPAFSAEFLDWDDDRNFVDNQDYRGLSSRHLAWMATTRHMGPYQPLSWLTLAVDHALWGMDARGYHATNVALHAAAAVALFFLALAILPLASASARAASALQLELGAFTAALAFAIHPLRCESVAWVTERRDVLSGVLFVLTLGAWLRHTQSSERGRRLRWYGAALALYLAALASKASGMVLPALLLVLDAWPLARWKDRRDLRALLVEKLPFAALAGAFAALAVWGQAGQNDAFAPLSEHGLVARAVQAGYAAAFYAQKTLLPSGLLPLYRMPEPFDPLEPRFAGPALAALAATLVLFALRRRSSARGAWTAWACYLILLAPTSGLAQAGEQLVADRYSYLASLPFALLAGGALVAWRARVPGQRVLAVACAALALGTLGAWTHRQTRLWRDSETLWSYTLRADPESAMALQNLGVVRLRQAFEARGDAELRHRVLREALDFFERSYALDPKAQLVVNRAIVNMLLSDHEPERRYELLERSRALWESGLAQAAAPAVPAAWRLQYAKVLQLLGRVGEAARELELAAEGRRVLLGASVESDPEYQQARRALEELGRGR